MVNRDDGIIRKDGWEIKGKTPHRALLELEFAYVEFWREFSSDCLHKEIRDEALAIIKDWKQRGDLNTVQIEKLRRWGTDKSLFLA